MSVNVSPTEESELTPNQHKLIALLVAGTSIVAAARAIGIAEKTAHTWLKQPAFDRIYQDTKQAVFDESLEGVKLVREMLLKHVMAEVEATSTSQLQAARLLLEHYEMTQLKEKMQEIEEKLQELGVKL